MDRVSVRLGQSEFRRISTLVPSNTARQSPALSPLQPEIHQRFAMLGSGTGVELKHTVAALKLKTDGDGKPENRRWAIGPIPVGSKGYFLAVGGALENEGEFEIHSVEAICFCDALDLWLYCETFHLKEFRRKPFTFPFEVSIASVHGEVSAHRLDDEVFQGAVPHILLFKERNVL